MMTKARYILFTALILFASSCVDEYWPELSQHENLLVVDGMITSNPGPYRVKLSLSSSVRSPAWIPLPGATVFIHCDDGETEQLTEMKEGIYETTPNGIQGNVGKNYRIEIKTSDGKTYQSPFEEIQAPVGIDTVYAMIEYKPGEDLLHELAGLQFYLDSETAATDTNYLMWNLIETYEYNADLKIRFIFDGTLRPFESFDSLETCWITNIVPQIFTSQTADITEPIIHGFPLNYVNTESRELFIRYSLLVVQYTLDKKAWTYWNSLREQNETQGELYTQQPYQIKGNVFNINDASEIVLGRFTAAGASKQRIFISKPELPFWFSFCEITETDIEIFGTILQSPPIVWPVYGTMTSTGTPALPSQDCMDCTKRGGTIEKPDFWEDE